MMRRLRHIASLCVLLIACLTHQAVAQQHTMKIRSNDPDYLLSHSRKAMPYDQRNAMAWLRQAIQLYEKQEKWLGLMDAYLDVQEFAGDSDEVQHAKQKLTGLLALADTDHKQMNKIAVDDFRPVLSRAFTMKHHQAAALLGKRLLAVNRKEEAFSWYLKSAGKGHAPAMVQVGLMYSTGEGVAQNDDKAASWLRPANVKKSALGKQLLAACFLEGRGVKQNHSVALRLLQEALDIERTGITLDMLGQCFQYGLGTATNTTQAADYYREACDLKHYDAYAHLADLTMRGDGVATNETAAIRLLKDGIDDGDNPDCMFAYGLALWEGRGVKRSKWRARGHIARAAKEGHAEAQAWCEEHRVRF